MNTDGFVKSKLLSGMVFVSVIHMKSANSVHGTSYKFKLRNILKMNMLANSEKYSGHC